MIVSIEKQGSFLIVRVLFFTLSIFISFSGLSAEKSPSIRIRIGKSLNNLNISGLDLKKTLFHNNKVKQFSGKLNISFNCRDVLKKLKRLKKSTPLASLTSQTGIINWKRNRYRGEFIITKSSERSRLGCDLINKITLENYISSLLAKEMRASWPLEALKAQAVAARSYAYHKKISKHVNKKYGFETHFDLENSELYQVNGSFSDETVTTLLGARETAGQILIFGEGEITPIFFHSKCGGRTLRPDQVWKNKVSGYESVDCPFCHKYGKKDWSLDLSENRLLTYVSSFNRRSRKHKVNDFRVIPEDNFRHQIVYYLKDSLHKLKKSQLRQKLGRKYLPSNNFSINSVKGKIKLRGSGYGHGVGLCQYGAYAMAKNGKNYKEILKHYFPKHRLEKIY